MVQKVESGIFDPTEKINLGTISDDTAAKIEKLTGINVKGFKVAVEARQINHILVDHGKNGKTDRSMSDYNDIAKMEYAMQNFDDISLGKYTQAYKNIVNGKTRGAKTILYEKSIGEKSYYVVQAVPDTKAKTLFVVAVFIGEKGYKKGAPQFTNAESLGVTSEIGTANASNKSIPQNQDLSTDKSEIAEKNAQKAVFGSEKVEDDTSGRGDSFGVKACLSEADGIGQKSIAYNERHSKVNAAVLKVGVEVMMEMAETMKPYLEEEGILPPDTNRNNGKTLFKNGSYGGVSAENTTKCIRTLTYDDFKDRVAEEIGRPLTPQKPTKNAKTRHPCVVICTFAKTKTAPTSPQKARRRGIFCF